MLKIFIKWIPELKNGFHTPEIFLRLKILLKLISTGVLLAVPIVLSLMLMWRRGYFGWLGLRAPADVSRAFYKRAPADDNYI